MKYLNNPNLPFTKKNYPGNRFEQGEFISDYPREQPSLAEVLKWQLTPNPQKKEKEADKFVPRVQKHLSVPQMPENSLLWLGHSTFLLQLPGTRLLTDPVFFDLVTIKRKHPLPFPATKLHKLNYILYSHGHRDHFDEKSLKLLMQKNRSATLLAPLNFDKLARRSGAQHIKTAAWFQQFDIPQGPEIIFLPALHWHRRGLLDFNSVLWGSFYIKTSGFSMYFAGDTGFADHFEDIFNLLGPVDFCIMPIGANKPRYIMKSSHVNPEEAAKASNILQASVFIPMHYGTYDLSDEPPGEPFRKIRALKNDGKLHASLLTPAVGEVVNLQEHLGKSQASS